MRIKDIAFKKIKNGKTGGAVAFLFAIILSFTVFAGMLLASSISIGAGNLKQRLGADIAVVPKGQESNYQGIILNGEPVECSFERKYEGVIRSVEGVDKVTPVIYLASLNASCCSVPIQIIGYDPKTDFVTTPWISDEFVDKFSDGNLIAGNNIAVDDENTLTFFGRTYEVGARLNKTGTGMDKSVYVSFDVMEQLISDAKEKGISFGDESTGDTASITEEYVSAFLVSVKEGYSVDNVAGNIMRQVPGGVVQSKSLYKTVTNGIALISDIIKTITYAMFISITLVTVFLHLYRVGTRKKEWAIYRMMGGSGNWILGLIFTETIALSFLGAVVGIALGALIYFPFSNLISQQVKFPFYLPGITGIILTALASIAVTMLSGVLPGIIAGESAARTECYELMREGEN
ncbi:ABC transporter permease [Butyrivibrio sp.]|uniref:ABC transporter permease n=1 Tax=Butyrivibrio sp. TaxID=28121 RepID=UPI0025C59B1B|nr:FtsX-like permease family protein [Butyrivibrio sp.]MBQ9305521.1 FtsX-like permease family protein [Butyrivibrio sp.]